MSDVLAHRTETKPAVAGGTAAAVDVPEGLNHMLDAQAYVCSQIEAALRAIPPHEEKGQRTVLQRLHRSHVEAYKRLDGSLAGAKRARTQSRSPGPMRPCTSVRAAACTSQANSRAAPQLAGACETKRGAAWPVAEGLAPPTDMEAADGRALAPFYGLYCEIAVLLAGAALIFYTGSGARSVFATCSLAYALQLTLAARGYSLDPYGASKADQQLKLRSRLALTYLLHWSLDAAHLYLLGGADQALLVCKAMLANVAALAVLFGMLTAMVGADQGRDGRKTVARLTAAQGVLGIRALIVWHFVRSEWPREADEYKVAAGGAQVVGPLVTMLLSYAWARLGLLGKPQQDSQ
jgi:hypothetical protein